MSIGILLLTHEGVGQALLDAAQHVMPHLPLPSAALSVAAGEDMQSMGPKVRSLLERLDHGDGVLVLSDLYGATPANMALTLKRHGAPVRCVSGVNLPMLLRAYNYADKSLDELAEIVANGGSRGICIDYA